MVIDVPLGAALALHGARPNPVTRDLVVGFALASGAPATLEVVDVAGRRVLSRPLAGLAPGEHVLDLGSAAVMRPGRYWLRLTQEERSLTAPFAIVR